MGVSCKLKNKIETWGFIDSSRIYYYLWEHAKVLRRGINSQKNRNKRIWSEVVLEKKKKGKK